MTAKTAASLYEYTSYREYLRTIFAREKLSSKKATLTSFGESFGMSASSLQMIMTGQRNLTVQNIHVICRALRLRGKDREFFEALVLMEQAADADIRRYYAARLKKASTDLKTRRLGFSSRQLIKKWYLPALAVCLIDFIDTKLPRDEKLRRLEVYGAQLGLPREVLRDAMAIFETVDAVSMKPEDVIHLMFQRTTSTGPQKQYLKDILKLLTDRCDSEFDNPLALFRGLVFSLPSASVVQLREDLVALFETYMALPQDPSKPRVVLQSFFGCVPLLEV